MSEDLLRIEGLLKEVIKRLDRLEALLTALGFQEVEEVRLAGELSLGLSLPVVKALNAALRTVRVASKYKLVDEVSKAIVKVLASSEGVLTLSELTRRVRKLRGRASRRTVAKKVRILSEKGVVKVERKGTRVYVKLAGDVR